jgi:hypothetical protein
MPLPWAAAFGVGRAITFVTGRKEATGWRAAIPPADGTLLRAAPPCPKVGEDVVNPLRAHHEAHGFHLHARTALPEWLGERLNVGYAIDVLHPLATG